MISRDSIVLRIQDYLEKMFGKRKYFALIYGSFINGIPNINSDIDLCVATRKFSINELKLLKQFIIKLHKQYGLRVDNEVPFKNKLIATYKDVKDAVYLGGLEVSEGNIIVPPIKKTREFLEAREIRLRLIFNALTTPHLRIGNDVRAYTNFRNLAEKNAFILGIALLTTEKKLLVTNLIKSLITGPNGENGEMYLGYKNITLVRKYLEVWLKKQMNEFSKK